MFKPFNVLLLILGYFICVACFASEEAVNECRSLPKTLNIDQVWGGSAVRFASIENASYIYVGYYDVQRWLTVSQINKCTGEVKRKQLNSRFKGWDTHNYISMAIDDFGRLHVSGNMHASPLFYARMLIKDDLSSLREQEGMVGVDELKTTYPQFFRLPNKELGFSYRVGGSGNGKEIINQFDGEKWSRWIDKPLFAASTNGVSVSAYHTDYVYGADGFYHVAWVWRDTADVQTNFHVNYAKSRDLKVWLNSDGGVLSLPITPDNAEVIDPVPQKSGLFNNLKLGFDCDGQVVISYIKFDSRGMSQLYQARRERSGWAIYQSTDWNYRWDPKGRGGIKSHISSSELVCRDNMLIQKVSHKVEGNTVYSYNSSDLRVRAVLNDYVWEPRPHLKRKSNNHGALLNVQVVKGIDGTPMPPHAISWYGMPNDTRDLERPCQPALADCAYSYELLLHASTTGN